MFAWGSTGKVKSVKGYHFLRLVVALTTIPSAAANVHAQPPDPVPPGLIRQLPTPVLRQSSFIGALVATADGQRLLTGSEEGVVIWDLKAGKRLRTLPAGTVWSLALSGDLLAVGDKSLTLQDLSTGKVRLEVKDCQPCIAISQDGSVLAAGIDTQIKLWKTANGEALRVLSGHSSSVMSVAFHPEGKTLYSVGLDGTLREWDLATGKETRRVTEPPKWHGTRVAVSADGKTLATNVGSDREPAQVRLLDTATFRERFRAVLPEAWACDVVVSPDGRYVAAACSEVRAGEGHARLWDSWTGKAIPLDPPMLRGAYRLCFFPDGKMLACSGLDGEMRLWKVPDGIEDVFTKGPAGPVQVLAFAPSGAVLASAWADGAVQLWDTQQGKLLHNLGQHWPAPAHLALSRDGTILLVAESGPTRGKSRARLWKVDTAKELRAFPTMRGVAALAPDAQTVATTDPSDAILLLDAATGAQRHCWIGHADDVQALAFSPDGQWLASASADRTVRLWHTAKTQCQLVIHLSWTQTERLAFSADGSLLFVNHTSAESLEVLFAGAIHVFETATGLPIMEVAGRDRNSSGFWLAPDGKSLVFANKKGHFRVIDLITNSVPGLAIAHGEDFVVSELSPSGEMLAGGHQNGRLQLWKPPPLPPRQALPAKVEVAELDKLWSTLVVNDGKAAYDARWRLSAVGKQSLALFRSKLRPIALPGPKQLAEWIEQLASESFKEREVAMKELETTGPVAEPALRRVLEAKPTLEVRRRIEILLAKLAGPATGEMLRTLRAIVILETIGGDEARAILRLLAEGAPGARITDAAGAALKRL
jgi:WD40 repeat protein